MQWVGVARMHSHDDHPISSTRVWWEGREVAFVRWTDQALVFAWRETDETAMHIPRGAVLRLMDRGVLRVDGETPAWLYDSRPLRLERPQASASGASEAAPKKDKRRFSAIVRLIRKLSGGEGALSSPGQGQAPQKASPQDRAARPKAAAQAYAGGGGAHAAPSRSARGVD